MALSYRYLIFDILTILKKDDNSSDIGEQQVLFWINTIANRLRQQRIVKSPTGRYLNIFTGVTVQTSLTSTNPNLVKNRKYIDLPKSVYDIMYEKGINYICHTQDGSCPPEFMNVYFQPTSPSRAQRLKFSPYEGPSPKNPYFYRVHDKIYFLGIESVNVRSLEIGLYTTLDLRTNLINLDDEVDLTEEHIAMLRSEILQLGSFSSAFPSDGKNDGENETQAIGKTPIPQQAQSE
jgi:hypothetical protein